MFNSRPLLPEPAGLASKMPRLGALRGSACGATVGRSRAGAQRWQVVVTLAGFCLEHARWEHTSRRLLFAAALQDTQRAFGFH